MGLFKPVNFIRFAAFIFILLCGRQTQAQVNTVRQILLDIKAKADSSIKKFSPEKVYLQTDRPYYSIGDTIWYRGWLIDAPSTLLSTKSGLLHVEIATDSDVVIQKFLLPVENGITWGNITLNEKSYKPGSYVIRAYTNWMRNFGEQTFFYKRITITGGYEDNWTVKLRTDTSRINGQPNVKAILQFNYVDRSPVVGKPVAMQVINGRKTLTKYTLDTELTGTVDINFKPPQQNNDLYISARVDNKGNAVKIPLNLKRADDIDLQFMPEGGNLVAGITNKIGFKAIDASGKGINLSGIVTDSKGNKVADLNSPNRGMGNFILEPVANEKYLAKITYAGNSRIFALPKVQSSGLGIFVLNRPGTDSLRITLSASANLGKQGESYFLIAKSRGVIHYAAIVNFDKRSSTTSHLNKNLFPTGITHILLTDSKGRTLNERLVFIDGTDVLKIQATTPRQITTKDSVDLNLFIADNSGKPVQGSFSVAVTDNARVKLDTLNDGNIITSLLLTSELRGHIEDPGFYFNKSNNARQALDDLLLTQGWVSYEPPAKGAIFQAENDYSVSGRVTNVFGKASAGLGVNLFSVKPFFSQDTLTDKNGRFKIVLPLIDTPSFVLRAVKKNGKTSAMSVSVDEFQMPAFTQPAIPATLPWNVNTGDTVINNVMANIAIRRNAEKLPPGTKLLQGVTISAKKTVKESHNLNGAGNADLVLDEKDMLNAGKKSLLDLIEEKVKGFVIRVPRKSTTAWYYVKDKFAIIVVDGIALHKMAELNSYIDIRDYLRRYTAESIKGIELLYSFSYNTAYRNKYFPFANPVELDFAFIEITTRGNQGPFMADAPGMYLYKPLPLSIPAAFYKPKYNVNTPNIAFENRPTIAWEPNIITNAEGKANIGFRAGITPGNYTVIVQGIGVDGSLGVRCFPLKVGAAAGP